MKLTMLIAVIMFLVTGFKLLASNGNPEKMGNAKELLKKIAIGIILIGAA